MPLPSRLTRQRVTRQLEALRNELLKRLAGLGIEVDQLVHLDRSTVKVDREAVSLVKIRRLKAGATKSEVVRLDSDCGLALRLYLRETGLAGEQEALLFRSLRGPLSEKTARRLVRKGPHLSAGEIELWWQQGI